MKIYYNHNIQEDKKVPEIYTKLNPHLITKLSSFESFLKKINNKHKINPQKENLLEHSQNKDSVLLTFDDGYKSFKKNVLPLLKKYDTPCILFITTDLIENDLAPYEIYLLEVISENTTFKDTNMKIRRIKSLKEKKKVYREMLQQIKNKKSKKKNEHISLLKKNNPLNRSKNKIFEYLSWQDIQELDKHPLITIGSHTKTHPNLKKTSSFECYKELKNSKDIIEKQLGHPINSLSYPYGANSYLVRQLSKIVGYKYGFATREKEFIDDNKFNIPRIEINNTNL